MYPKDFFFDIAPDVESEQLEGLLDLTSTGIGLLNVARMGVKHSHHHFVPALQRSPLATV